MLNIIIQHHSYYKNIPEDKLIAQWVKSALGKKASCAEITIRIVNKKESAILNQTYRNKTGPTNVLSFDYETNPVCGDIVLCAPLIKNIENWAHLIIHGTLHLMGYDHIHDKDAHIMEQHEIKLLKKFKFKSPYI